MRIDHYSLAISLNGVDLQFRILESHKPVKLVIDIGVIHKERHALSREGV